jgi:HAD superfamily hydrolase (TIGR01509 family)
MIDMLFLDAGGVLLFPNWVRVSEALARHDVHVAPATLAASELRAKYRLDVGDTIRATRDNERGWLYFDLLLEEAGVPGTASTAAALKELREYHERENLWELVPADVIPTLARLRAMGLKIVVVSNANGRLRHVFGRLGLTEHVDVLFDSFEEGVEKPDPRLFQIALERSGGAPATTMHVGDLYHVDVVGARAAGLQAVLLDLGGLYVDYECPKIRSFAELPEFLKSSS